jgi:predicted transposase YdaD
LPKIYDDALKKLFQANAQDFVSLVQEGLRVEELLPTELDNEHIYADGLVRCRDEDGQAQLVHFEYQREKDERMGERLLEYNLKASRRNDYLPVLSCVLYLKKEEKKGAPRSPFFRKLPNGTETTRFWYAGIHLGDLSVEQFLEEIGDRSCLLPLLPLTEGGNRPEAVDIMIEELIGANKTDLLWVAYTLAAKVFSDDNQSWLKRRFALMNDFLWDSPVYQEMIAGPVAEAETRGEARGRIAGAQTEKLHALSQMSQELLNYVQERFPTLKTLARKCLSQVEDNTVLLQLGMRIAAARTEQEVKEALKDSLEV